MYGPPSSSLWVRKRQPAEVHLAAGPHDLLDGRLVPRHLACRHWSRHPLAECRHEIRQRRVERQGEPVVGRRQVQDERNVARAHLVEIERRVLLIAREALGDGRRPEARIDRVGYVLHFTRPSGNQVANERTKVFGHKDVGVGARLQPALADLKAASTNNASVVVEADLQVGLGGPKVRLHESPIQVGYRIGVM